MATVTYGQNFGQSTAAPNIVTEGTTVTTDVAVSINVTNATSAGQGRGEIRRMLENIMNRINDGDETSIPGI
jgi:hypothetical protein